MATVNGLTAETMQAIRDGVIVGAAIVSGHLILTKYDGSTIDTGSVIGPTGSPGATSGELATALAAATVPIGSVYDFVGLTAPTNHLLLTGQTVASAQTLYPTLWGLVPAGWKSGSSLLMPDTRRRVTVGYDSTGTPFDTIGEVGGEEAHTLTEAELAVHRHEINHNHPDAPVTTTGTAVVGVSGVGGTQSVEREIVTRPPDFSGIYGTFHTNLPDFLAQSGYTGGDVAHNNMQPYIVFTKIIKAK